MSSYNDRQIDATLHEQRLVSDRAKLRTQLRAEFQKQVTHPYRHMNSGYLFDPAMQRWMSMRVSGYDYFKPTSKSLIMPACIFAAIFGLAWILKKRRGAREHLYRTGQVAYKDRKYKFV